MSRTFSLTLLRHGYADIPEGCCFGQLDISLTEAGKDAIDVLAKNWPTPYPERIFCSDLSRTAQTAQILARQMNVNVISDPRLREVNFGAWEGKSWEDIYAQDPERMQTWGCDWLNTSPPRGESVLALHARVSEFYQEILDLPQMSTLVIAHAGSLRALAGKLQNRSAESLFDLDFCHGAPISLV